MNVGQFSGFGGISSVPDSVPIGGTVRFSSSAPLEVVLPDGQVYLRSGILQPETWKYGQLPSWLVSPIGTTSTFSDDTFTGTHLPWPPLFTFFPFVHSSQSLLLAGGHTTVDNLYTTNAAQNDVQARLNPGGFPPFNSGTLTSAGNVGIELAATNGSPFAVHRNVTTDFSAGWSLVHTAGFNPDNVTSVQILNAGTNWVIVTDGNSWSGGYFRSSDNGATWTSSDAVSVLPLVTTGSNGMVVGASSAASGTFVLAVPRLNQRTVGLQIYRSVNGGVSYNTPAVVGELAGGGGVSLQLRALGAAFGNGRFLVLDSLGRVFSSSDDGLSWSYVSSVPVVGTAALVSPGSRTNMLHFASGRFWIATNVASAFSAASRLIISTTTDGAQWASGYLEREPGTDTMLTASVTDSAVNIFAFRGTTSSASRATLPIGSYVNNAIPLESNTANAGSYAYVRVK